MAGEEKFEFVQPTGREHVFVCCGARYGRFMYAQLFGDVAQDHRAHRFGSIITESSLLFNYGLRNAQKSIIAGFQTVQNVPTFLQMLLAPDQISGVVGAQDAALVRSEGGRVRAKWG